MAGTGEGVGVGHSFGGSGVQGCPRSFLLGLGLTAVHPMRDMVGTPSLGKKP